ncbi:MAG: nitrite reductase small subunit NirD [Frankiaceae bacterium]|nr:nitrite reductase small subunit NirD [Frankiaceae bacterium]
MTWRAVCLLDQLPVERGVCALVDGHQVALFRTGDGELYAVDNRDPFSGAMVLSRGIVGCRDGQATVASPMYKHVFSLATGHCLDDAEVSVSVHPVRVRHGAVQVSLREETRQPA